MMSEKQLLRDKLSAIVETLSPENKHYFEDIEEYMFLKSFLKDERFILEQLFSMASDLKYAEIDGMSAVDFFGIQSHTMADELLKNAPKARLKDILTLYFNSVFVLYGIETLSLFSNTGRMTLELWTFLMSCLIVLLIFMTIFSLLPKIMFKKKVSNISLVTLTIFIVVILNIASSFPKVISDYGIYAIFPEFMDWVFVSFVTLLVSILVIRSKIFKPFAFPIMALLIGGLLQKLATKGIVHGDIWTVWLPTALLLIGTCLFYWFSRKFLSFTQDS